MAAPVVYNRQGANPRWEPFSIAALKDLGKTAKEFGKDSPHFKSVFQGTLDNNITVPADLKYIMSGLLEESQYIVWEQDWKELVRDLHKMYQRDQGKAFLTLDHLFGEGDFRKAQDQANVIPTEVLGELREAAKMAFFQVPTPGVPSKRFATIRQEPGENFSEFYKKLKDAVGKQIKSVEAQREVLTSLLRTNASEACIQKIDSLPFKKPTLEQMVEACIEIPPEEALPHLPSKKPSGKPSLALVNEHQRPPQRCFNCGDPSHFAKSCPKLP